jgi:hypothetical protein
MQFKGKAAILAAATALVAGGILAAAPAQAAERITGAAGASARGPQVVRPLTTVIPTTYTTDDNPGGEATFQTPGQLWACDDQADGYGVIAYIFLADGNVQGPVKDSNSTDGCKSFDTSIVPGAEVHLQVCLYKGGVYTYYCRTSGTYKIPD